MHRENPDLMPRESVNRYRAVYRRELFAAKKRAHDKFIRESGNSQCAMWKLVGKARGTSPGLGGVDPGITAEQFNECLVTAAEAIVGDLPPAAVHFTHYMGSGSAQHTFDFQHTTYITVRDKLCHLKNSKSTDCYGIGVRLIKALKDLLVYPLTKLINQCISNNALSVSLKGS